MRREFIELEPFECTPAVNQSQTPQVNKLQAATRLLQLGTYPFPEIKLKFKRYGKKRRSYDRELCVRIDFEYL